MNYYNNNYNNINNIINTNNLNHPNLQLNNLLNNFFSYINDNDLIFINDYTKDIIIKINNDNFLNSNEKKIDLKANPIINDFIIKDDDYITSRKKKKKNIISENLIRYSLCKNFEDIIRFSFNEKYNPISICNELISFNRYKDVSDIILRILSQNNNEQSKLLDLTDEKGQTIYHLIPLVKDNFYLCKKIEEHNISNIYDKEGNTPIYNACKNFDVNFIETFSHYSFDSSDNIISDINYNLFLETKNKKTPLEALYEQLNKKEDKLLKLIIDISISTKTIAFIPLIKYLIQNYKPNDNKTFKLNYQVNLNSNEYIEKIIGLYQFYINNLNGDIMAKDEFGNDPFFLCIQYNNYDFMFNILIEESNIKLNSINNEGKSIIHLIIQSSGNLNVNKKNLLREALISGFDFNIKDNDGMLPLDYAISIGDYEIVSILKEFYKNLGIEIKENNNIINLKSELFYDYNSDSDNFYNESISVSMNIDKSENLNGLVSPMFKYDPLLSFYQVCVDEESSIPFSVNLVKKNFKDQYTMYEEGKKFCLRIIKDLYKDNEFLTISVDNLDLKTFTFSSFKTAQQKFKDLFKEMTANDWDIVKYNRLNFKTDYTKYYIFDYTYEE